MSCAGTIVRFLPRAGLHGFTIVCCSARTVAGLLLRAGTAAELNLQASHNFLLHHIIAFQRTRLALTVVIYDDRKAGSKSPACLGCTIRPSGMRFGSAERELRRSSLLSLKWDHVGQRPGLKTLPVYGCTPEVGREASELAGFWGDGTPFFRQYARLREVIRPKHQPRTSLVYDESRIRSHRKSFAGS